MRHSTLVTFALLATLSGAQSPSPLSTTRYDWRYYRPGNTGIQGDYCDSLWVGSDNDPWIGGYDPGFEEGGISRFVQAENRWVNISNIDYPEIGHPEDTGTARARDITADTQGVLWMGTGRGVLRFNPAVGPKSLKRWGAENSAWPGGWVTSIEMAPDGTVWASGYGTVWGGGGLMRFNPGNNAWTYLGSSRPEVLAIQPRPGGGYYVWAGDGPGSIGQTHRYDSTTQTWTVFPNTNGNPRNLPSSRSVDANGNLWIHRVLANNFDSVLDIRRPDGTWVGVPQLPQGVEVFKAFGDKQAIAIAGGFAYRFNGTSWANLGQSPMTSFLYDIDIDSLGNVWICGVGGAAKRTAATGTWQRHRLTNNGSIDSFVNDLALLPSGGMVSTANGAPGYGGMQTFDGTRWTGFNNANYGLGHAWPFPTDNSESVCARANGNIVANPMFNGIHEWNGSAWQNLNGTSTAVKMVEDSLGRLWALGEYFNLAYWAGGNWHQVGITAWGANMKPDPDQAGTVWATTGHEVKRTDGLTSFSRLIDDFPELTTQSDTFSGLAVGRNGVAWIGATKFLGAGGTGGALIKLNAVTGSYTMWTYEDGWPFPGHYVAPIASTSDGKLWMVYTNTHQSFDGGLCWWDGNTVGKFPGPIDGAFQWGGLPHTQVTDCEVKVVPGGYELWLSCASRGIAVLKVHNVKGQGL